MKAATLLVGGGGLLGRELVSLLSQEGKEVIILEGVLPEEKNLIPPGVDEVIFVAHSADWHAAKMTRDLFFVNTALLVRLLQESSERRVPCFAYCSTGSVYAPSDTPSTEESLLARDNLSPYVATKLASEMLIQAWPAFFKRLVTFRPFFNYGPGQNSRMLFSNMFRKVLQGEDIYLPGGRGLVFNPVYVGDFARFVLHALRLKQGFDIYNVAGRQAVTLFDAVTEIAALVKKKPCFVRQEAKESVILADISKMQATGFVHRVNLAAGLREMQKALREKDG